MLQKFNEEILPGVTKRYRGSSIFGSDARAAYGKATSDLGSSLTGAKSKLLFDSREAAKNRKLQAAGMIPGLDRNKMQALLDVFAAQGMLQGQAQGGLDREYAEFVRGLNREDINIDQQLRALGLSTTNTVVTPGQPGFITNAGAGVGSAFTQAALQRWLSGGGTGSTGSGTGSGTGPTYGW
jgi:hypothetical protein